MSQHDAIATDPLVEMLQCPKCGAGLASARECAACDTSFPLSRGQPVLIDFDDSIFRPEAYADDAEVPQPETGGRIGRFLGRLTYGTNAVAERAVASLKRMTSGAERPRILVIGGGTVGWGMAGLYDDSSLDLVSSDAYASANTRLVCDGHKLPFKEASFDAVVIQAVLEHVLDPPRVVGEIHRVLKPNGIVYADTPFIQQVHMGAYDFSRFTFSGHRWLFRNFEEIEAGLVSGPGIALLWSIAHMARSLGFGPKATALVTAPFFWLRLLDRWAARGLALDGASGVYFMGRKSGVPLKAADMPSYYQAYR